MRDGQTVYVNEADTERVENKIAQPRSVRNRSRQLTETEKDHK